MVIKLSMEEMNKSPLPKPVAKILSEWHRDSIREEDCKACSSACCSHSGFAILENVTLIYEKYKDGKLVRSDYEFPKNLTFTDFVSKYFDIEGYSFDAWIFKKKLLVFHMRSLAENNEIISLPRMGNYWMIRASLFNQNPWLNKGCVFLNKKVPNWPEDDKDSSRMCILHAPDSHELITEKPIDCIFFTCTQMMRLKTPTPQISEQWLRTLAVSFPDSIRRYNLLLDKDKQEHAAK